MLDCIEARGRQEHNPCTTRGAGQQWGVTAGVSVPVTHHGGVPGRGPAGRCCLAAMVSAWWTERT